MCMDEKNTDLFFFSPAPNGLLLLTHIFLTNFLNKDTLVTGNVKCQVQLKRTNNLTLIKHIH